MKTTYVLKISYSRKVWVTRAGKDLPSFTLENPGQGVAEMNAVLSELAKIGFKTENLHAFRIRKIKKGLKEITPVQEGFPTLAAHMVNSEPKFHASHEMITIAEFLKTSAKEAVKGLLKKD